MAHAIIRKLKQQRGWVTHANRKQGLFPLNIAMTLENLYCQLSLLSYRQSGRKCGRNHCPRIQKSNTLPVDFSFSLHMPLVFKLENKYINTYSVAWISPRSGWAGGAWWALSIKTETWSNETMAPFLQFFKLRYEKKNLWVAFYDIFSMIFMTGAFDIFRGIMMSRISVIQHYLKIFSPRKNTGTNLPMVASAV